MNCRLAGGALAYGGGSPSKSRSGRRGQATLPSPATAPTIYERLFGDIVALIEANEAEKPAIRGPYKKSVSS